MIASEHFDRLPVRVRWVGSRVHAMLLAMLMSGAAGCGDSDQKITFPENPTPVPSADDRQKPLSSGGQTEQAPRPSDQ
jgi:hypothetical protein